jgi:hypothetical protein
MNTSGLDVLKQCRSTREVGVATTPRHIHEIQPFKLVLLSFVCNFNKTVSTLSVREL